MKIPVPLPINIISTRKPVEDFFSILILVMKQQLCCHLGGQKAHGLHIGGSDGVDLRLSGSKI
jgi:hypothetical protein